MTNLNRSILMLAAGMLGAGLLMSPAYAFNPQPDPPAKGVAVPNTLKSVSVGTSQAHSVSPGPCRGSRCRAPHGRKTGQ
jgi:hypothetical protein